MAIYKDPAFLQQIQQPDPANLIGNAFRTGPTVTDFDAQHRPGERAPFSGIYRCSGCRHEVASNSKEPLPPQNHHQHTLLSGGQILWQLIVATAG